MQSRKAKPEEGGSERAERLDRQKFRRPLTAASEMYTKTAISYDIHEVSDQISRGYAADARRRIGLLVERLDFMLKPREPGNTKLTASSFCFADEYGRDTVQAVRVLCEQASRAIGLRQSGDAQSILHQADELWQTVPDIGRAEPSGN